MPRDINTRLENLRIRRKGVDAARSGRVTASVADEVLRKSVIQESWQRRATEQPYTRYALGAMQAVDPAYTQKSHDEACLLYTSPSPRDRQKSRMPSSA